MSETSTIVPLEGLPFASIDARCARLSLEWPGGPLCCARGVPIDVRSKLAMRGRLELAWSDEGPILSDAAPSGVFERLATLDHKCAANESDPVRGEGCRIRWYNHAFLPPGCALFPLDVVDSVLVPSPRIPDGALVEVTDHISSLWDDARARFVILYGDDAMKRVDAIARDLRGRRARNLHLRTVR